MIPAVELYFVNFLRSMCLKAHLLASSRLSVNFFSASSQDVLTGNPSNTRFFLSVPGFCVSEHKSLPWKLLAAPDWLCEALHVCRGVDGLQGPLLFVLGILTALRAGSTGHILSGGHRLL